MKKAIVLMLIGVSSVSFAIPMERLLTTDTPFNEDYNVKIALMDSAVNWSILMVNLQMSSKILPWFVGFKNIGFKVGMEIPIIGVNVGASFRWLSFNPKLIKEQVEQETENLSIDPKIGWVKFSLLGGYELDDNTSVYAALEFTKTEWNENILFRPVIGASYYIGKTLAIFGEASIYSGLKYSTPPENETWYLYNYYTGTTTFGGGLKLTLGPVMVKAGILLPGFKVYLPGNTITMAFFPFLDLGVRF